MQNDKEVQTPWGMENLAQKYRQSGESALLEELVRRNFDRVCRFVGFDGHFHANAAAFHVCPAHPQIVQPYL